MKQKLITIPNDVEIYKINNILYISGPLGILNIKFNDKILLEIKNNKIKLYVNNSKLINTYSSILYNNILGVTLGYNIILNIIGITYKIWIIDNVIFFILGTSHKIKLKIPNNIIVKLIENNILHLFSINKCILHSYSAYIVSLVKYNKYNKTGIIKTQKHLGKDRIKNN